MSAREVIAYAITHAPRGQKGGPYEAIGGDMGDTCERLSASLRWPLDNPVNTAEEVLEEAQEFLAEEIAPKVPHARVIRIVRARPSEASATLETARRRLASVAESMTEHAYQEMASALEVDACRVGPSEASAVEVLRSFIAWVDCDDSDEEAPLRPVEEAARHVLAASGPDPSAVVRAAMRFAEHCTPALEGSAWFEAAREFIDAVDAYRKAGGTP